MRNFVNLGLAKIEQNGIYLLSIIQSVSKVLYGQDELRFTGAFLPESMLYITEEVVVVKVTHYMAMYYVLKDLTAY